MIRVRMLMLRFQVSGFRFQVSKSPLEIEHIIQDAGSPGFEIFAREVRAGSDARRSDVGDQR